METTRGKILIVDDDQDVLTAGRLLLKQRKFHVQTESDPHQAITRMGVESCDVVLLDMNFTDDANSGMEGFHWLERICDLDPSAVVILITAYGDVDMAVKAMRQGATDFVLKPWQNEKLIATISAGVQLRRSRREALDLRSRHDQLSADLDQPFTQFVGRSPSMLTLFREVSKVAKTDANVLILGENGVGKELVAREIHRQSARAKEAFITVDMGAISESLFESEIFGHVKGAFTDALSNRVGRFETASGGSLFLDEIGNLSLPLQVRLLSALETRQIVRLGSNKPISVDVRLICATNMPLHEMVERSEFRQDLIYRINTVELSVPPLRDRHEDISSLVNHFVKLYSRKYGKGEKDISSGALNKLQQYHWPGNVRELQHAVERAVIMGETQSLEESDFLVSSRGRNFEGLDFASYDLEEIERTVISHVLRKQNGNVSRAALELGLTRASLYRRMERHGL